jgi:hypothetical protein
MEECSKIQSVFFSQLQRQKKRELREWSWGWWDASNAVSTLFPSCRDRQRELWNCCSGWWDASNAVRDFFCQLHRQTDRQTDRQSFGNGAEDDGMHQMQWVYIFSQLQRHKHTHTHIHTQSFGNGANEDGGMQEDFEDWEMEARRVAWISWSSEEEYLVVKLKKAKPKVYALLTLLPPT